MNTGINLYTKLEVTGQANYNCPLFSIDITVFKDQPIDIAVLPDITVGCRETMHLCLKATKSASNLGKWASNNPFSDLLLSSDLLIDCEICLL